MAWSCVLLLFIIFGSYQIAVAKEWICNEANLCIVSVDDTLTVKYNSQNICRLSCGKYGSLWPHPTSKISLSNQRSYFDPSNVRFHIVAPDNITTQFISDVNRLFIRNIIKECQKTCFYTKGKEVLAKVSVKSSDIKLDWSTDESYQLVITESDVAVFVDIKANTIFGARHSIETLSQLITANVESGLAVVSGAQISDKPIFQHRGLLLDTARNYIPVRNIRTTLDGMATSKLNVFHWHATDTHSFPIEIPRVPQLQRLGAYSQNLVYSKNDILKIIKYAHLRGIRVLIELDAPSHAGNGWQFGPTAGLGNLAVCINKQPWRKFCIQSPCGQLNPVNENVYTVLKKVFEDISEFIPVEETIHMGGDEVFLDCWNSTKEIVYALHKRGLNTSTPSFLKLWSEFHLKNLASWDEIKSRRQSKEGQTLLPTIVWSSHLTDPEIIEQYLPKERFIIQTWVESTLPLNTELIKKGYRIIASTKDAWYLDHGFWGVTKYYNWKKVYENRLTRSMLGGEPCMWTEYVDENNLDGRIWPRAGAAAERLWSDPNTSAVESEQRFFMYRERLITRGIKPESVIPKWCTINEGQCN